MPNRVFRFVRNGLVVVLIGCVPIFNACARPDPPGAALSAEERRTLSAVRTFDELFVESRRVQLSGADRFPLSVRPLLRAVNTHGDWVVLDKLNVRDIYVFARDGSPKTRIGTEGRGAGEYIYPHLIRYHEQAGRYYVYDGDLLRVLEFDEDFRFVRLFGLSLFADDLIVTAGQRHFVYSSSEATTKLGGNTIHEIDAYGQVLNRFARQPSGYNQASSSEGGGLVEVGGYLYTLTPYEYTLRVFTLDGRETLRAPQSSPHYVLPGAPPKTVDGVIPFDELKRYHASWSHIRQLLAVEDRMIAVVFSEPGSERTFLDVFDLDLTPVIEDLELPAFLGDLHVSGDTLYYFLEHRDLVEGILTNPTVVERKLAADLNRTAPQRYLASLGGSS